MEQGKLLIEPHVEVASFADRSHKVS